MIIILGIVFLCQTGFAEKHSLHFTVTASSGVSDFSVGLLHIDGVQMTYLDQNTKTTQHRQDWVKKLMEVDPRHWVDNTRNFFDYVKYFKDEPGTSKQSLHQTGGIKIVQMIFACEWDDETGEIHGYVKYAHNGEPDLRCDQKTKMWTTEKPNAAMPQQKCGHHDNMKRFVKNECQERLRKYFEFGRSSLQRKDLPSVSLLQKTPSSPVSCHATGFYPDRAEMFWRKDGEELHEDVEPGKIFPNHDGSFRWSFALNVSSIAPEDWGKYECVFKLSGVKDDIITKLDKAMIKTNWVPPSEFPAAPLFWGVLGLLVICIVGVFIWRRKKK